MIANYIYQLTDPPLAFFLLYLVIVILMAIAYKLGFARKLPVLKQAIVYLVLAVGCLILAFMGYVIPIADILVITVIVLAIVRYRMTRYND
ncbi:hypothetical protein CathTA2_2009 [Caldalkalibacillus thermarum TA2.A1]|uniref:YlaH-like family protein n=1 Tax=Caldalkalibacillus thermarum (strain TA2.A1) TaxID=986075 RepID=F5L857_CALTT|nr:YlaH-like family protein [Caldalkalibacillus thermarum]EGL82470.1 hypothetical protein CathTA2_2009 [Caldalkalibacillus thermarum TA2.A1]QZT33181.1 YlaH-like family protein [Caldalkalibacillus thermarum TA2.A1]GGK15029.1 membrane protein [Caldalkalibacillus thermarum]